MKHLAKALREMVPPDGLVVSVNGPWGSGKTTVLGFIEWYLKESEEPDKPQVVRFNPWWFSGCGELTRQLLNEMVRSIDSKSKKWAKVRKGLAHLANIVDRAPKPGGPWGLIVKWCLAAKAHLVKEKGLDELRRDMEKALRGPNR